MDIGILLLRLLIAAVLLAHAAQKTLGWFQGNGLAKQAGIFASLGLRPGRVMVSLAAASETLAAVLLALGALTPLGVLVAVGTMTVAGLTMHLAAGKVWNAAGGGEYPYFIAATALALGFTGPGDISVDRVLADSWSVLEVAHSPAAWTGLVILGLALLAAAPFAVVLRRQHRPTAA